MSTMLLETAEGLGEPAVSGAAGELWNLLQSEKETVCKCLAVQTHGTHQAVHQNCAVWKGGWKLTVRVTTECN